MPTLVDKARAAVITMVLAVSVVWALPLDAPWHDRVRAPLWPVAGRLGLNQSWAMFAIPDDRPRRLEVHVREGGVYHPIYQRWEREAWGSAVLRQRRVRGLYDAVDDETSVAYWNFTRWVAREALLAHPNADAVRIRMIETQTTLPNEPDSPDEELHLVREHRRTAVLPEDDL